MITETTFELRLAATMATSAASTSIGGAIASGLVSLTDTAAVFYPMGADAAGGSNRVQYAKIHDLNTDGSATATNYGVFLANGLPDLASAAVFSVEGDPADEGVTVTFLGFTSGGDPIQETCTIDSAGEATCSTPIKGPVRVLASAALSAALTILHGGVAKGVIPAGGDCASSELDIGLAATLNDSATIATPSTAPSGVTFSRPITSAARLLVNGGAGSLAAGSSQGIWLRWTVVPEMLASRPVKAYVLGYTPD